MTVAPGADILAADYITSSAGAGDSGRIPRLNSSGVLDSTFIAPVQVFTYGETISAGQPLYLKASDGKVYKASSASANEAMYGYVGVATVAGVLNDIKPVATIDGTVITGLSLGTATTSVSATADFDSTGVTRIGSVAASINGGVLGLNTQFFITGKNTGNISKIDVVFDANNGSPTGGMQCIIYPITVVDTADYTLGSGLATSNTITPTPSTTNTFIFSSPPTLQPNTMYVIVFYANTGTTATDFYQMAYGTAVPAGTLLCTEATNNSGSIVANAHSHVLKMKTYYTVQFNYNIGDICYLGNSSGTIVFDASNSIYNIPIGRVLSSSSIVLEKPTGRKYLGTKKLIAGESGSSFYTTNQFSDKIRNSTRMILKVGVFINTGPSGYTYHTIDLNMGCDLSDFVFKNVHANSAAYNVFTIAAGFFSNKIFSMSFSQGSAVANAWDGNITIDFYR